MPKLPAVSGPEAAKAFRRAGMVVRRQSGSHLIMSYPDGAGEISIPLHGAKDLVPGILRGLIRDAGLTVGEFRRLLKG